MALSNSQRDELFGLCIGMFDAAPGANYLHQLVSAREAGASLLDIANALATKPQFQLVYGRGPMDYEVAQRAVGILLPGDTPESARTWAYFWIREKLQNGASIASVLVEATQALLVTDNPNYASAKALMANRIEVASYYSAMQGQSSTDLTALQDVLSGVSSAPASVATAKAAIDDNMGGKEFTLTTGADNFTGTIGNDRFIAGFNATVFTESDYLNGGAGIDTLTLYARANINDVFPNNVTLTSIEVINLYREPGNYSEVDAARFTGAGVINQIGSSSGIINLGAGTTAGFQNVDGVLSVVAAANATSASVAVDNVPAINSLLRVMVAESGSLNAVTINGALSPHAENEFLLVDIFPGVDVETLTLNTSVDVSLATYNLGTKHVSTLDATGSTGRVQYTRDPSVYVSDIRTGTGDDDIHFTTGFSADVTHATISTGDGDDKLEIGVGDAYHVGGSVSVDAGTGNDAITIGIWTTPVTVLLNAGLGDDLITLPGLADSFTAKSSLDGGEGTDRLELSWTTPTNEDYDLIASTVKNVEIIRLSNSVAVDASRLASYTRFEVIGNNVISNLADDQKVTTSGSVNAIAAGYKAATATDAAVYAGTLDITVSPPAPHIGGGTTRVYADTVNLSIKALAEHNGVSYTPGGALGGDVKVAHVTLVPAVDNAGTPDITTDDIYEMPWFSLSAFANVPDSLAALNTVTISGNGNAQVTNYSHNLTTVDASGLDTRDINGEPVLGLRGLSYYSNNDVAETVKLSGSVDNLHITNSTVASIDTIYGFTLVGDAGATGKQVDLDRSDRLELGTNDGAKILKGGFVQAAVSATVPGLALAELAASTNDKLVFHFDGNTYVYCDVSNSGGAGNGTVDATDILLKLVGTLDLDLLTQML